MAEYIFVAWLKRGCVAVAAMDYLLHGCVAADTSSPDVATVRGRQSLTRHLGFSFVAVGGAVTFLTVSSS